MTDAGTLVLGPGAVFILGVIAGALVWVPLGWRLAWLLHRPLPRPWRPVLRYLAPGTVWRDVRRCWTTGRWT
jgi:hypothetical protein